MLPLADNVLIDGVGCGEAEDESSDCNHDNTKDYQSMPAVKEKTKEISVLERAFNIFYTDTETDDSNVKHQTITTNAAYLWSISLSALF